MGPQYTSCVEEKDYSGPSFVYIALLIALTAGGGIFAVISAGFGGLVATAAFIELLRYFLNYLVNGKLICLHRQSNADCLCGGPAGLTVCALGEVADTEDVGQDKNFIQDLDDDYAINLVLFPFEMSEFVAKGFIDQKKEQVLEEPILQTHLTSRAYTDKLRAYLQSLMAIATDPAKPQADLLARSQTTIGKLAEFGYLRDMVWLTATHDYLPWTDVVGRDPGFPESGPDEHARWLDFVVKNAYLDPTRFAVPVLHCEFEGSRLRDMLDAIQGFPFGGSYCKKNFFTKFVCRVLSAVFAPLVLALVLLAYLKNKEGSIGPALAGGGTIGPKSRVIVRGRWVYDTGHPGWNEIHAVRVVQLLQEPVPPNPDDFKKFLHTWCEKLAETPVSDGVPRAGGGAVYKPQSVPAAETTRIAQQQPENKWEFHPLIDGCVPVRQPPPPPPPPPPHIN